MYGWFEPGAGVNKFFYNTKMTDVLLRTSTSSNALVFGNSGQGQGQGQVPLAAMYIAQNSVGVQKLPDPNWALDVAHNSRFETSIVCGDTTISSSNVTLGEGVLLTSDGLVQNKLVVSDQFVVRGDTISLVVSSCSFDLDQNVRVSFQASRLLEKIVIGTVLQIDGSSMWATVATPLTNTIVLRPFFGASTTVGSVPFAIGARTSVQIMQDISKISNSSSVETWFNVNNYTSPAADTLVLQVSFQGDINLVLNQYYSFGLEQTVKNIVQLVALARTLTTGTITLKTLDGQLFPSSWLNDSMVVPSSDIYALLLLDVIEPPSFQDVNAIMGTYTSGNNGGNLAPPYVVFKNMTLARYINRSVAGRVINAVRKIVFNSTSTFYFSNTFIDESNANAIGQIENLDANTAAISVKGTAIYKLVGNPIMIRSITPRIGANGLTTYYYTINDLMGILPELELHVGSSGSSYLYFCCGSASVCKILFVDTLLNLIELDGSIDILDSNAIYYVVPYKLSVVTNLGSVCYAGKSLSVGTRIATESLTVAGDASIVGKLLIKDTAQNVFPIVYDGGKMMFGPAFSSTQTLVTLEQNTVVNGTLTATDFFKYSDARIKKNIRNADCAADYELVKKLEIKDFDFKEQVGAQKGVIAQRVAKLFPKSVVQVRRGFVPSICKIGQVTSTGSIVLRSVDVADACLQKGDKVHVKVGGTSRYVVLLSIRRKRDAVFLGFNESWPIGTDVYVRGPCGKVKVVNKDYLFMTLFSATKHLIGLVEGSF